MADLELARKNYQCLIGLVVTIGLCYFSVVLSGDFLNYVRQHNDIKILKMPNKH